jgi:hypothetical protein
MDSQFWGAWITLDSDQNITLSSYRFQRYLKMSLRGSAKKDMYFSQQTLQKGGIMWNWNRFCFQTLSASLRRSDEVRHCNTWPQQREISLATFDVKSADHFEMLRSEGKE